METLVAPIPRYSSNMVLADESNHSVETAKLPAPLTSGCRIEGFVRVKKVNTLSLLYEIMCSSNIIDYIFASDNGQL